MNYGPQFLLVTAVIGVGVFHTMVPDHWVPIALIARERGWSRFETARAALQAGIGHALSTLLIAVIVWLAGVALADRFGRIVDTGSSLALVIFGSWIAISSWRDLQKRGMHGHGDHNRTLKEGYDLEGEVPPENDALYVPLRDEMSVLVRHVHTHRHKHGSVHSHWHDHTSASNHTMTADMAISPPLHDHRHKTTGRTALLLILGSSPMVEGIPAFFAASKYGVGLIILMGVLFTVSTIATYVLLCVYSTAGLQRLHLGAFEQYGEVLSGVFIALIGIAFWIWIVA
ncbi:MAG: hypothetical protein WBR29_06980 [Gammaproteobacteria bacterium]